jgi:ATP-dependent DNA helicase PIF1
MGLQNKLSSESSAKIDLNEEFRKAMDILENSDHNIFITGKAGTGKSTLLEYFRSVTLKNAAILAPTGVAALNIKGQTIHSFFRFKPDITPESVKQLGHYAARQYKSIDIIVIDEISMVRADLLDCVDQFMRFNGKDQTKPFGGAQMAFIGDLYQLPPVVPKGEEEIFKGHYKSQYFFDSHSFKHLNFDFVELKKHYRQSDDRFIELLNAIRNNSATDEHINELNSMCKPRFAQKEPKMYITLTTTNALADRINSQHLSRINKGEYQYRATITGDFDKNVLPADEMLKLRDGAQIMMLNNDANKRWVNGSIGKVSKIDENENGDVITIELIDGSEFEVGPYTWELFKFSYDSNAHKLVSNKIGGFTQYPMMLAWAVTIHKSQGKTFQNVIIDIGEGTFAHGQLYVALSRCTTMEGIILTRKIERKHILMDNRIIEFLEGIDKLKN